jgi:hypothetical protein
MQIRIQLFTLMRIRIQLPEAMRIHMDKDPDQQPCSYLCNKYIALYKQEVSSAPGVRRRQQGLQFVPPLVHRYPASAKKDI